MSRIMYSSVVKWHNFSPFFSVSHFYAAHFRLFPYFLDFNAFIRCLLLFFSKSMLAASLLFFFCFSLWLSRLIKTSYHFMNSENGSKYEIIIIIESSVALLTRWGSFVYMSVQRDRQRIPNSYSLLYNIKTMMIHEKNSHTLSARLRALASHFPSKKFDL